MSQKKPAPRSTSKPSPTEADVEVRPQTWLDPGTWSASFKFLPAYVVLVAIFIAVYWSYLTDPNLNLTSYENCVPSFNYSFRINAALTQAREHAQHGGEVGYVFDATQEIYNPERSVFGRDPFPRGKLPPLTMRLDTASLYVESKLQTDGRTLYDEENAAVSDPASLGVPALMFAQKWSSKAYMPAATRQKDILLNEAPRFSNGAISDLWEHLELRSDAIGSIAPFLAYYGVASNDLDIMREAVKQIKLYRDILIIGVGQKQGLWRHIAGGPNPDAGAYSMGNAKAAFGMARVRATLSAWPTSRKTMTQEISDLDSWIQEILDGALHTGDNHGNLLQVYLGDGGKAETSGTSLLTATVYRMAKLRPDVFAQEKYLNWAHAKRRAVTRLVDDDGWAFPASSSYERAAFPTPGSAEGQSFLILMATAWRDCVCSGHAASIEVYLQENPQKESVFASLESLGAIAVGERALKAFASPLEQIRRFGKYFLPPS